MNKTIGFILRVFSSYALGILTIAVYLGTTFTSRACTVFVLTDGKHTYFFNNEDYSNPNTRIWFIPGGKDFYGAAYLGFNDGEAQGGVNTEGLAFDWVTVNNDSYGVDPNYVPAKHLSRLQGTSSDRMLEQCKTVEEAIKFYQTYTEPAFARTTLVIADKTGASVIIGSKDGQLYFDTAKKSRGLGYGEGTFNKTYKPTTTVNVNDGIQILKQCVAPGDGGTKYSNSYDLNNGVLEFYNFTNANSHAKLNLNDELKKGSHYYDIAEIATQASQPPKPLQLNMNRLILYNYTVLADQEPKVTAAIKNMFGDVTSGTLRYDDLTEPAANELKKSEEGLKPVLLKFGSLKSVALIDKQKSKDLLAYSYIVKYDNVIVLWQFLADDKNKIHDFNSLSVDWLQ